MRKHEYFEELCALSAAGQCSPEEETELREHLLDCAACRESQEHFAAILREWPATRQAAVHGRFLRRTDLDEFRQRFAEQAPREGVRLSEEAQDALTRRRWALPLARLRVGWAGASWIAASLVLGIALGAFGYATLRKPNPALQLVAPSPSVNSEVRPPRVEPAVERAVPQVVEGASDKLMATLKAENSALSARLADVEKRLSASESDNQELRQVVGRTNEVNAQLSAKLDQNDTLLTDAKAEVEKARSDREAAAAELAAHKTEFNDLSEQVRLQHATLDQQRQLLAAGRDITDLMGARNLHMIDVRDADGIGKDRRSFGRVFYTEGKSLIFYAFDLDEKKVVDAKYKFEAWGERLGQPSSVKSLGILYSDDKAQRRWVLKVDDPRRIAQIDSVFVTLEPRDQEGGAPRGKRILYAFLGGAPNHP